MFTKRPDDPSALLRELRDGREGAADRLIAAVYDELRRIAGGLMRHERPGHTLQPSAFVHEAVLRLIGGDVLSDLADRHYLFLAASRAMRQVLVDHARKRRTAKRSPGATRLTLDDALAFLEEQSVDVADLHEALEQLAAEYPRQAQVVDLRFFGGRTVPECAELLDVSDTTVETDWRFARTWLKGRIGEDGP
jgi:RNA polymerase sigma factor (TIGR02999 family)